jgi:hypothetical protein
MSHKRDMNVDLADAITPQKSPQLKGHSTWYDLKPIPRISLTSKKAV